MQDEIIKAYEVFCRTMKYNIAGDDPKTLKEAIGAINSLLEFTIFIGPALAWFDEHGKIKPKYRDSIHQKIDRLNDENGEFLITVYKARRFSLTGRITSKFKKTLHGVLLMISFWRAWWSGSI